MADTTRSLLVPSLVYVGAVILVGLPATAILYGGFGVVFEAVGRENVFASSGVSLLFLAVSLLIGLQLAVEAAAVQLGGVEALGRGSPRVAIVRYGGITVGVFILLAAATWIGLSTALAGFGWEAITLGLLVGLAGLFVLYRSTSAFVSGLRGNET